MVLLLSNNLKLSFSSPLAADATSVMASSEILVWQNAPLGFNDFVAHYFAPLKILGSMCVAWCPTVAHVASMKCQSPAVVSASID